MSETEYRLKEKVLSTQFGVNINIAEEIDSTNEWAQRELKKGAVQGSVYLAKKQTNGKGRLGREWISGENQGIYMSVILKPRIDISKAPSITLLTGLAVKRGIEQVSRAEVKLKWPNDLLINEKKFCGILCRTSLCQGALDAVIVGVGINVCCETFSDDLKDKATCLTMETGEVFEKEEIVAAVLNEYDGLYKDFIREGSFSLFREEYKKACINIGRQCVATDAKMSLYGKAEDITMLGELVIQTDGGERKVIAGDVSVRGVAGYV